LAPTVSGKPTRGGGLGVGLAGALREGEAPPGGRRKYVPVASGPVPDRASPREEPLPRASRRRFVVWRESRLRSELPATHFDSSPSVAVGWSEPLPPHIATALRSSASLAIDGWSPRSPLLLPFAFARFRRRFLPHLSTVRGESRCGGRSLSIQKLRLRQFAAVAVGGRDAHFDCVRSSARLVVVGRSVSLVTLRWRFAVRRGSWLGAGFLLVRWAPECRAMRRGMGAVEGVAGRGGED